MKTQNNKLYLAAVDKRRFQFIQRNSQKVWDDLTRLDS